MTCGLLRSALLALVLLDDFAGQTPAFRDVEALLLRPGAYLATACPVCQRPDWRASLGRPDQARVLEKTRELLAKVGGMPGIEVNLVRAAIDAELHCLVGWAAGQVILKSYIDPLHYAPPEAQRAVARPVLTLQADLGHSRIPKGLMLSAGRPWPNCGFAGNQIGRADRTLTPFHGRPQPPSGKYGTYAMSCPSVPGITARSRLPSGRRPRLIWPDHFLGYWHVFGFSAKLRPGRIWNIWCSSWAARSRPLPAPRTGKVLLVDGTHDKDSRRS